MPKRCISLIDMQACLRAVMKQHYAKHYIALTCNINIYFHLLKYKYDAIYSICNHQKAISFLLTFGKLTVFTEKLQNEMRHHGL